MARIVVFQLNIFLKQDIKRGFVICITVILMAICPPISNIKEIVKNTFYLPGTDQGSAAM